MCTVLLPPGANLIAVNKYIISYHISYHINDMGGALARLEARRGYTKFLWGNLMERDHLVDPDVDGRVILIYTFRRCDGIHGLD